MRYHLKRRTAIRLLMVPDVFEGFDASVQHVSLTHSILRIVKDFGDPNGVQADQAFGEAWDRAFRRGGHNAH